MQRPILRLVSLPVLLVIIASSTMGTTGAVDAGTPERGDDPAAALAGPCDTFPCYTLTFTLHGDGSGSVKTIDGSGNPDGLIDCRIVLGVITAGSTCSHRYIDTQFAGSVPVAWVAAPDTGNMTCLGPQVFCSRTPVNGQRSLSFDIQESPYFHRLPFGVSVSRTGTGTGTVASSPAGINCGATCQADFLYGSNVTLTAIPDAGASFAGWTGACAAQDATCELTIPASNVSTNAVFTFGTPTPTPTPMQTPGALVLTTTAPVPPGAKDPVILWGQGFTLGVALGSGQANRSVALQGTRDGVVWTPIQTVTTDGAGRASLVYRPVTNLYYRAVAAAAGGLPELTSNQVRTTVRQLSVMRPTNGGATRSISSGTKVTFTTTVRPSRPELARPTVSFYFARQVTASQLEVIRRDVLVDASGVARTTFDFPIRGAWTVRSQANPTPYNANSLMTPLERYRVN